MPGDDYCILCQDDHKMVPSSCYICRTCGVRGHLSKDCSKSGISHVSTNDSCQIQERLISEMQAAGGGAHSVEVEIVRPVDDIGVNMSDRSHTRKYQLCSSTNYSLVSCHIETLRSSHSSTVHITQLGCVCFPFNLHSMTESSMFRAVVPPGLDKYLDNYRLSGDLLQALHMTREEDGSSFLYRRQYEQVIKRKERTVCVSESQALEDCILFLEKLGLDVILVGVDEDTLAVLIAKLKIQARDRFMQVVKGFTYWRRLLKHIGVADYKQLELEDYHQSTFSNHCPNLYDSLVVAEILVKSVTELAKKHHMETKLTEGSFVTASCISSKLHPRQHIREVMMEDKMEILQVFSSFRPEFAVSVSVEPIQEVCLDTDSEYGETDTGIKGENMDIVSGIKVDDIDSDRGIKGEDDESDKGINKEDNDIYIGISEKDIESNTGIKGEDFDIDTGIKGEKINKTINTLKDNTEITIIVDSDPEEEIFAMKESEKMEHSEIEDPERVVKDFEIELQTDQHSVRKEDSSQTVPSMNFPGKLSSKSKDKKEETKTKSELWRGSETYIVCPECCHDVEVTVSVSEHMKSHGQFSQGRSYLCMHCLCQLNFVDLNANNVLKHMQMEHGLVLPRLLSIQPSNSVNSLICPACPKSGINGTRVMWHNMEKHFIEMHTKFSNEIKLICHDCGTDSVRLKDLYKHKTCNKIHNIRSISKRSMKSVRSKREKFLLPSLYSSSNAAAASLQESVPSNIHRQNSSILCISQFSSKQDSPPLSLILTRTPQSLVQQSPPISSIHKRLPISSVNQSSPILPRHESLPISQIKKRLPITTIHKRHPISPTQVSSSISKTIPICGYPSFNFSSGEGGSTNSTKDDAHLRKNVILQSGHFKKRKFKESVELDKGREFGLNDLSDQIKEAINISLADSATLSKFDEEVVLSRELYGSSESETEEGEIKDDSVGPDEATDEVITSSANVTDITPFVNMQYSQPSKSFKDLDSNSSVPILQTSRQLPTEPTVSYCPSLPLTHSPPPPPPSGPLPPVSGPTTTQVTTKNLVTNSTRPSAKKPRMMPVSNITPRVPGPRGTGGYREMFPGITRHPAVLGPHRSPGLRPPSSFGWFFEPPAPRRAVRPQRLPGFLGPPGFPLYPWWCPPRW